MFFQNVFTSEFLGNLVLGDRSYSLTFKCPSNAGRGDEIVYSWNEPNYDFSGNDADSNSKSVLNIWYAIDQGTFRNWSNIAVTISTSASVSAETVVSTLNANDAFQCVFEATTVRSKAGIATGIQIKQKKSAVEMRFYIANGRAETVLGFNKRAGVSQMPEYFARHTIANRFNFDDSFGNLIYLNPSTLTSAALINNAVDHAGRTLGFSSGTVLADWQLLEGNSGLFTFVKQTVDSTGSGRVTQKIEYPAGAIVGDFAKKTTYTYTGSKTAPDQIAEVPYVLTSGDLITP